MAYTPIRNDPQQRLAQHSGMHLLTAPAVLLKGIFECPEPVHIISGPAYGAFERLWDMSRNDEVRSLLGAHGVDAVPSPTAEHAISLVARQVKLGRRGVVVIPNVELDRCMPTLAELAAEPSINGSMLVILEDAPLEAPAACPRRAASRLGIPCLEPPSLSRLRLLVNYGIQISQAASSVVAVAIHRQLLCSLDTIPVQANRIADAADLALAQARRPRRLHIRDDEDVLNVARRAELNRMSSLPNPGERAKFGFITVGPTCEALEHVTNLFKLRHRIPLLRLELLNPIDEVAIGRFLLRCDHALVLEPRCSSIEPRLLEVAERLRQVGECPALLWGDALPEFVGEDPSDTGAQPVDGQVAVCRSDMLELASEMRLHPSLLVRRLQGLFEQIRPGANIHDVLARLAIETVSTPTPRPQPLGHHQAEHAIAKIIDDVERMLRDMARLDDELPTILIRDRMPASDAPSRLVEVEQWTRKRFMNDGLAAVSVASRAGRPVLILVHAFGPESEPDLERLARAATPASAADRVRVHLANLAKPVELRQLLYDAALRDSVSVMIVSDGPPARFDFSQIEGDLKETDRLGFQQRQRMIWRANVACTFRPDPDIASSEQLMLQTDLPFATEFLVDRLREGLRIPWRARLRILSMQVQVQRSRPPTIADLKNSSLRPRLPQAIHARNAVWRVHLAGYRGDGPGVIGTILAEAGRRMGYHVKAVFEPTPASPSLHGWSELVFTRLAGDETEAVASKTPFGEADLLLGLHGDETARAIHPDHRMCVAAADRTTCVLNSGTFVGPFGIDTPSISEQAIASMLKQVSRPDHLCINNFSELSRQAFHTDRLADVLSLGYAFQRGLVPASLQAIVDSIHQVERTGYGRLGEAFELGRRLHEYGGRTPVRAHYALDPQHEARRLSLMLRQRSWDGRRHAEWFRALVRRMLQAMPGLAESDAGRQSQVDFINGLYRCSVWGGQRYAERYSDLILQLYEHDRGDTGRALTREFILPLADAMLLRDPIYIASMSMTAEEKRRIRSQLNIKLARGDVLERRFLTRFELVVRNRRIRMNLRTSVWLIRLVAACRHITPLRWRGTRRKQRIRERLIRFMRDSIAHHAGDYDSLVKVMRDLRKLSEADRFHSLPLHELSRYLARCDNATFSPRDTEGQNQTD